MAHGIGCGWRRRTVVWMCLLTIAGCGTREATGTEQLSLDLDASQQKWTRTGLRSYQFTSAISCYCPIETIGPLTVYVSNGEITRVVNTASQQALPLTYRQPIDSVFAFIRQQVASRPDRLRATYDPVLGYPRTIAWGTPENDAGGSVSISDLTPIP